MTIVVRACERRMAREGQVLPEKTAAQRTLLEAPANAFGVAIRLLMQFLPADLVVKFHDWLYATLAKGRNYPFDAASPALEEARKLACDLEEPALIALISHPPVHGDMAHMNLELVRHATLALRHVRGKPCRPRLVVAVDLFALDTITVPEEGVYAGFMGRFHLGFDRLAVTRGWASSIFVSPAAWPRMIYRLLGRLGDGGEVGMVLAGGVPQTARVLYAAREWAQERRRESPLKSQPARILANLRKFEAYRNFEENGPCGPGLRRSAWRMMEAWLMSAVAEGEAELGGEGRFVAESILKALEVPGDLAGLEAEMKRETPYRGRFFRVLAGRARRRPLLFIPVIHHDEPGRYGVEIKRPWAWKPGKGELAAVGPSGPWRGGPSDFAKAFGQENFK
jgi:hypothetical protein